MSVRTLRENSLLLDYKNIYQLMTNHERYELFKLFGIVLLASLFDVLGVASFMPFFMVLANPSIITSNTYLERLFDFLGFNDVAELIYFLAWIIFFLVLISVAFRAYVSWAILRFTNLQSHRLSIRLIKNYMQKPYEWFLSRHSGELSKTALSEVAQVVNGILIPMVNVITQLIVVTAIFTLLLIIEPKIALFSILFFGTIYIIFYFFIRKYLLRLGKKRTIANKNRYKNLTECFGGIKEIKTRDLELFYVKKYELSSYNFFNAQVASQLVAQLPRFFIEAIIFGGILILVITLLPKNGSIADVLPTIGTYILGGYRVMPSIQAIYSNLSNLRFSSPVLHSISKDLTEIDLTTNGLSSNKILNFKKSIRLECVSYSYPMSRANSLNKLSIEIFAGSCVGIAGLSGAGKTTAMDIILGLLKPQSGKLIIDSQQITSDLLMSWRESIGYVSQNVFLTDDILAKNIAFGLEDEEINWDALFKASKAADLHEFIINDLPDGYDTMLGERGVRLSGGQRQRIAIARALYREPKLLVLDEATSALDNIAESNVIENISNLKNGITTLIVAHRLSTIRNCDYILFLQSGTLHASGTYNELCSDCPDFLNLVMAAS
jgi:ABC-type bacteriocin/lantibiotic exporter with double-glycine peptidase domain